MTYLMKLELKKISLKRYCFISVGLILFSILFITISLIDSATDPAQSKDTFDNIFLMIEVLLSFIYIVFFGVLVSSIIIKEYNTKTILIMFSYPIQKAKLILAKLFLISIFISLSMLIGFFACCGYTVIVYYLLDLLAGNFELTYLINWLFSIITTILVCICLGGLTFCLGMLKKSVPFTIVGSIFFIFLRQVALSSPFGYAENLLQVLIIVIFSCLCIRYIVKTKLSCVE